MKGYRKIKKKNNFPEVPGWRKVVIASLAVKGMPTIMFTVNKYAKGWTKGYKSYEKAFKDRPDVTYYQ